MVLPTAKSCVLPRGLYCVLLMFAWLFLPLWLAAAIGAWFLPGKGVVVLTSAASMGTLAAVSLFLAARADAMIGRRVEAARREQWLATAVDKLCDRQPTQPMPVLKRVKLPAGRRRAGRSLWRTGSARPARAGRARG